MLPRRHAFCLTRLLNWRAKQRLQQYSITSDSATVISNSPTAPSPKVHPQRILSGIQPTGVPHIGNYLGALRQWVDLQAAAQPDATSPETTPSSPPFFSVVDLHALTIPQDPKQLREWRRQSLAALLAVGLDPLKGRCCLFFQSDVSAHTELMWILSTIASTGYLSRMTQWKSKLDLAEDESMNSEATKAKLKLGLFSYPVLQAADVLLYRATAVPVGEDQKQHLEFARTLAGSFNHSYGEVFPLPDVMILPTSRVLSLRPSQTPSPNTPLRLPKMSKSHPSPLSRILLTDTPTSIRTKILSALTDSNTSTITYEPATRPGVSNLLNIYASITRDPRPIPEIASLEFDSISDSENKMKHLKMKVADMLIKELDGVRERFDDLLETKSGSKVLEEVAEKGKIRAREAAEKTMKKVRRKIGLN